MTPLKTARYGKIRDFLFEVCCRFGFPKYIVSDNGKQFVSRIYKMVWKRVGTNLKYTSPYHPQSNLTESENKTIKGMIMAYLKEHVVWNLYIPEFGFALGTAVRESTKVAPCDLNNGRLLRFPWDINLHETYWEERDPLEFKNWSDDFSQRLHHMCKLVKTNIAKAQAHQKK